MFVTNSVLTEQKGCFRVHKLLNWTLFPLTVSFNNAINFNDHFTIHSPKNYLSFRMMTKTGAEIFMIIQV